MSEKRQKLNRAVVVVYMPDGCRLEWTTKRTGTLATDAAAFGHWLMETGETIIEGCNNRRPSQSDGVRAMTEPASPRAALLIEEVRQRWPFERGAVCGDCRLEFPADPSQWCAACLFAGLAALAASESAPAPVVSSDLRKHLDEAFRLVGEMRQPGTDRRRGEFADEALREIKEAMLLAYPDSESAPATTPGECEAFRAGWATGFQECAEGATIDWAAEKGERPNLETAALERWLFVKAAAASRAAEPPSDYVSYGFAPTVTNEPQPSAEPPSPPQVKP